MFRLLLLVICLAALYQTSHGITFTSDGCPSYSPRNKGTATRLIRGDKCYMIIDKYPGSFSENIQFCNYGFTGWEYSGKIPIIRTDEETNWLIKNAGHLLPVHINLVRRDTYKDKYDYVWGDGVKAIDSEPRWAEGQVKNKLVRDSTDDCAALYPDGTWHSDLCFTQSFKERNRHNRFCVFPRRFSNGTLMFG